MITHLKIKVLYAVCFSVVSAVNTEMIAMLVFLFNWAPVNMCYAGSRQKGTLFL